MVTMRELTENRMTQAALMVAGECIKKLSAYERLGWTLYLLEMLDDGQDDYEQMLTDIQQNIETRLAEGSW